MTTIPMPIYAPPDLNDAAIFDLVGGTIENDHLGNPVARGLDGVNDYVQDKSPGVITGGTAMTAAGEFQLSSLLDTSGAMISQVNATGSRQFLYRIAGGGGKLVVYYFQASGAEHDNFSSNDGINYIDGLKHFYSASWSLANGPTMFIDGVKITSITTEHSSFATNFGGTIQKVRHGMTGTGTNKFKGDLAHQFIWDLELTDDEHSQLHADYLNPTADLTADDFHRATYIIGASPRAE